MVFRDFRLGKTDFQQKSFIKLYSDGNLIKKFRESTLNKVLCIQ